MPRVVFMCGPAGAGKSTTASQFERSGMVRLSFDQEAWSRGYETFEQFRSDFVRHRELADAVAGLREAVMTRGATYGHAVALGDYLSWAEQHLKESDPTRRIRVPQGERPDLSYGEWTEWKRQNPQRW